jgi:hypothetical protein
MPSHVTSTSAEAHAPRWSSLLPAGTFLAGCALGAVVMGVGEVGSDDEPTTSAVTETVGGGSDATGDDEATEGTGTDGEDSDLTVRVPEACVQAATDASALVDSVDRVVAAVADLDLRRLRETVDEVQQVRDGVQEVAEQCREIAAGRGRDAAGADDAAPETPSS